MHLLHEAFCRKQLLQKATGSLRKFLTCAEDTGRSVTTKARKRGGTMRQENLPNLRLEWEKTELATSYLEASAINRKWKKMRYGRSLFRIEQLLVLHFSSSTIRWKISDPKLTLFMTIRFLNYEAAQILLEDRSKK